MSIRRVRAGGGLSTDPSALDQPEGLRVAENVSLHRPGTVQPRPGFGDTTGIEARTTDYRPIAVVPFDGDLVVQGYDSGVGAYRLDRASADTQYTGTVVPPDVTVNGVSSFMEARGSFYLTTTRGVVKLADIADSATTPAGAWMTYQPPALSTAPAAALENAALEPDTSVAYRWCVVRTDANDYQIRSAPSARTAWAPVSASSYTTGLNMNVGSIYLPTGAVAGDVLELYRTRNSGDLAADPGEDYFLVGEYTLTSTDISNGNTPATTWADTVKDHELGAALYTSASQFGALSAKEIPPYCSALAQWSGVAWAGNVLERAIETVTLAKVARWDSSAGVAVNEGSGLCTLSGEYTGVSGGDTLTGVTFDGAPSALGWDSLVAGMWLSDTSPTATLGRIPVGTRIVSFNEGAQTITLDQEPTSSGAFNTGDIVQVGGYEFFAYTTESVTGKWFDVTHSDFYGSHEYQTALSLARISTSWLASEPDGNPSVYALKDEVAVGGDGGITFLAAHPGTSFTLWSETRGSAFVPDLSTSVTVEAVAKPGGLAWSAPEEPEAWPPANFTIVGKRDADILALVPTRDALLIWKTDGLYALTGVAPSSWSVREVDVSLRLVAPQCTCVLDGVCFALTDRGVVAATASGVQVVSGPIGAELRAYTRLLPLGNTDHKRAWWMVAHPRLGLVVLGVGEAADSDTTAAQYVFHARAGGRWSKWLRTDRCAAYDPAEDRMVVSPGVDGWALLYERSDEDSAASYRDVTLGGPLSPIAASWSGSVATIAQSALDPYVPAAGDVLANTELPAAFRRVTAVEEAGANYALTVDGTAISSALAWHQGYACAVEWQAQHLPGQGSRWQEEHVVLEADASAYVTTWPLDVGGQPSEASSASTVTATVTPNSSPYQTVRVGVPRAIVRAYQMGPRIAVNCAGVLWRVAELALHFTGQSPRVRRA